MGFPRQEYWSGLSFPPPGDLPDPGIKPPSSVSPAFKVDSLPLSHLGSLFLFFLIGAYLLYNVVLVSAVQQSESVVHIHISTLFKFYFHIGHYSTEESSL